MTNMASTTNYPSSEYVIYHPENLRLSNLFCFFIFRTRVEGGSHELVEFSTQETKLNGLKLDLNTLITLILQKFLLWIDGPLALLGTVIEFILNLFSLNGGIFKIFFRLITGKLVIPRKGSADFRSIIGHIDGRVNLQNPSPFLSYVPQMEPLVTSLDAINPLDLTIMAAKIVYENKAFVQNAVNNHWKMHLVGFYDCWNEYLHSEETQAFIFTDTIEKAQVIGVAFRGTEPFNAKDWVSDVDLSWISMGDNRGRAHLGFMKALGLQDSKDYKKGWPKTYNGDKKLAYYIIRDQLNSLLEANPGAKIIVTGHSLGGALATIFISVLMLHQENDILNSLYGVYTYGQPRVGDKNFGEFVSSQLNSLFRRYFRIVYRYDVVPRVPFDDPIFQFSHFGGCLYYTSWFKAQVTKEEPARNYFNILYLPSKYFNAWLDLFRGLLAGIIQGQDYKEGLVSILFRAIFGLILPGIASHSPRDYVNSVRLGKIIIVDIDKEEEEKEEDKKENEHMGFA